MAITPINTLRGWFENGDVPTQDQFWAWMDAYWHKNDAIPMNSVGGLEAVIADKATVADIENVNFRIDNLAIPPASALTVRITSTVAIDHLLQQDELLEKIVVVPSLPQTFSVGTTPGGQELSQLLNYPSGLPSSIGIEYYAFGSDKHIYINGITASTLVIIYKRK